MEPFTDKELKNLGRRLAYTILYAGYIWIIIVGFVFDGSLQSDDVLISIGAYLVFAGAFAKVVVPLRTVFIMLTLLIVTLLPGCDNVINIKVVI